MEGVGIEQGGDAGPVDGRDGWGGGQGGGGLDGGGWGCEAGGRGSVPGGCGRGLRAGGGGGRSGREARRGDGEERGRVDVGLGRVGEVGDAVQVDDGEEDGVSREGRVLCEPVRDGVE